MRKLLSSMLIVVMAAACAQMSSKNKNDYKPLSADEVNSDIDLKVHKYTLPNGLRLLVYENKRLPIFSFYTFFNVGGRHEGPGTTGATHFLEHMMFKGAKKYGPGKFDQLIEGNGGNNNAYTTFDGTVYYESMPADKLETVIDLEADRMENLLLLPESFEKERGVVMEERKMRYENSPRGQLYLAMMQSVFKGTPYGGSVIGEQKDLINLNRDQVMEFFHKFYTPDNAVIVIAGDVDAGEVYDMVKEKYGHLTQSSTEIKDYKAAIDDKKNFEHRARYGREIKLHGSSPTPIFMMAYKGEPLGTRRGFVMDILSSVLGDGGSSYFHQKYVMSRYPKLANINASNYTLKYNGVFYISGQLLGNTSLPKFKEQLVKDTQSLCKNAITDRNVQKTKNQYMVQYYNDIQSNAGVAHFLGLREAYFNNYEYYKNELKIYDSITADEVREACHSVFNDKKFIFLSVWDKHPAQKRSKK